MKPIKRIILLILVCYTSLVVVTVLAQRSFMYFPSSTQPKLVRSSVSDMQQVTLHTEDALALNAWYKAAAPGKPTILFMHGNGGDVSHRQVKARAAIDAGFGMLLFDYRGYGGNAGEPNKDGLQKDTLAALNFLHDQGLEASDVVYYGESIGTGLAAWLASNDEPLALILETPYTRIADVVAEYYYRHIPFARHLVWDDYNVIDHVRGLEAPVLILHGEQDEIIPFHYAEQVFAAASEPKQFWRVAEGTHNDLHLYGSQDAVKSFIESLE